MLAVHDLEIRVGARLLMEHVSFRVEKGDKIGLVGRNGAGKTTMTKALAGEAQPTDGKIERSGEIGYLPQDPRSGNPEDTARKRILDARGLGELVEGIRQATLDMASEDPDTAEKAMRRYSRLDDQFNALGGYAPRPRRRRSRPTSSCRTGSSTSPSRRSRAVSVVASSSRASCSRTPRR